MSFDTRAPLDASQKLRTPSKQPYEQPVLTVYGSVKALTASGSSLLSTEQTTGNGGCDADRQRARCNP